LDVCNNSDEPLDLWETLFSGSWKEQMAILFWTSTPPHGNAGPQTQRPYGEAKTTSSTWCISGQRSFLGHVSCSPSPFHAWNSRRWQPHDSRGHGEGRGCPVGCSRRQWPYGHGRHDSAK
jgi:hypothetical protein